MGDGPIALMLSMIDDIHAVGEEYRKIVRSRELSLAMTKLEEARMWLWAAADKEGDLLAT